MNGQIKSYLQKCWVSFKSEIQGPNGFSIIGCITLGVTATLLAILYLAVNAGNPNRNSGTPMQQLHQRIVVLDNTNTQLQAEQVLMLEDINALKHQNHNLTQALITITTDITKLNNVYNSRDLSITYSSEVEEVRQQVDTNMKLISDTITGAEGGK